MSDVLIQVKHSSSKVYLDFSPLWTQGHEDRAREAPREVSKDSKGAGSHVTQGSSGVPLEPENGAAELTGDPSPVPDEAFFAGLRQHEAELVEATGKLKSAATALQAGANQLQEHMSEFLAKAEHGLAALAMEITRKVISVESRTNEEVIKTAVREGLSQMKGGELSLRLHPQDVQVIRMHLPQLAQTAASGTFVRILEDEKVERGGCIIESVLGELDMQPSTRLERIGKVFQDAGKEL